jgi:hypothetical protein
MRDRAVRRPWWPKCLPWPRVLTGEAKASRPGGRLETGDEDPTLEPRIVAAWNARHFLEHLVGDARKGCNAKPLSGQLTGLGPIQAQQATNGPIMPDAVVQGSTLDFWLMGQLGRAHWATYGPVTLSAR